MGLFSKKKSTPPFSPESAHSRTEKERLYLQVIPVLLQYMKSFSFDLKEIDADAFKNQLTDLAELFEKEEDIQRMGRHFDANKSEISDFIDRKKEYFFNKEFELKDIINLLSTGLSMVNSDNRRFNALIHEETLKLEEISELNDIRKIKEELRFKIADVKKAIQKKQTQDAEHLETLSSKVETLKIELEETKNASLTDGLTGAFNRLALDTKLIELIKENKRGFSLLMLDIDNFKLINDSYGHQVGDRVLVALVQKCQGLIREGDYFARYGGEEFMIVLPGTSLKYAVKKAKLLCQKIAETEYAVDEKNGTKPLSFTVSIGASSRQRGDTVESLTARTDKALYEAKHRGKDQVVSEKEIN